MPVVQQSTSATTTAAAGSSACSVVLQRLSVASVQHTSKNMTVGNRHSEKAVTASRGKRHICLSEDDVEPDDSVLADSDTGSRKYCH